MELIVVRIRMRILAWRDSVYVARLVRLVQMQIRHIVWMTLVFSVRLRQIVHLSLMATLYVKVINVFNVPVLLTVWMVQPVLTQPVVPKGNVCAEVSLLVQDQIPHGVMLTISVHSAEIVLIVKRVPPAKFVILPLIHVSNVPWIRIADETLQAMLLRVILIYVCAVV
jgi:hypothetical protein